MATYDDIVDINLLTRFYNNFGVFGVPLADWKPHTKYKLGTCVVYDGNLYRCKTAHTSDNTFDENLWTLLSSSGGEASTEKIMQSMIASAPTYYERDSLPVPNKTTITISKTWVNVNNSGFVNDEKTLDLTNAVS